jgi:membrane protein YdbS with pleckstrin-like domain
MELEAALLGAQEELQDASAPHRCLVALRDVSRWVFAVTLIVGHVAYVVANLIVAAEFYEQGDTTWFAVQVAFLIASNLAVAVFALEFHVRHWPAVDEWSLPSLFALCVVIGPSLPLVTYIGGNSCQKARERVTAHGGDDGVFHLNSRYMREETKESAISVFLSYILLGDSFNAHFRKYGVFYVETLTGAIPQAVIQLLAITHIAFLGGASYAQLISLCCSLFSIMSKAVIFAASYDVKVFIFSFLLVAHDVFSTFYLFSTVMAQETQKDTDFLGLPVSYLGYAWLAKAFVSAACYVIGGGVLVVVIKDGCYSRVVAVALGALVMCSVPLAAEFLRLGIYPLLRFRSERQNNQQAADGIATLWNFLRRDDSSGSRLRHIVECVMTYEIIRRGANPFKPRHSAISGDPLGVYRNTTTYLESMISPWSLERPLPVPDNVPTDVDLLHLRPAWYFAPLWQHVQAIGPGGRLTMWDVERLTRCSPSVMSFPRTKRTYFFLSGAKDELLEAKRERNVRWAVEATAVAIFTLGQILSFVYPFINASVNFRSHNLLQTVCFYGLCATLLLALPFVPATYRHQVFRWSVCSWSTSAFPIDSVRTWIAGYYTPTSVSVALEAAVDVSVVPGEVMAAVVAPFVGTAVDVSAMTRKERHAVRGVAKNSTGQMTATQQELLAAG